MNGGLWFYDYEIVVIDAFSFRLILGIEIAKVKKRKKFFTFCLILCIIVNTGRYVNIYSLF